MNFSYFYLKIVMALAPPLRAKRARDLVKRILLDENALLRRSRNMIVVVFFNLYLVHKP